MEKRWVVARGPGREGKGEVRMEKSPVGWECINVCIQV